MDRWHSEKTPMQKAFKFRAYPIREQMAAMAELLDTHRHLYNHALAERKEAWEQEQRGVSYGDQSATLKAQRMVDPYLALTNFSSCQATLRRLDAAFQAFFRRVKAGDKPGYPRFRGRGRYDMVVFPSYGDGCKLREPVQTPGDLRLQDGYRLVLNCKDRAGQTVPHLHLHLLGGRDFGWPPG